MVFFYQYGVILEMPTYFELKRGEERSIVVCSICLEGHAVLWRSHKHKCLDLRVLQFRV